MANQATLRSAAFSSWDSLMDFFVSEDLSYKISGDGSEADLTYAFADAPQVCETLSDSGVD